MAPRASGHPGRWLPAAATLLLALSVHRTALAQGFGGTVSDHLVRGDSLLSQGRSSEAIVQFQEARTLCPTPAEIVTALQGEARAHVVQRELLPAAGLFEEAAGLFPDDPRAADLLYAAGMARQQSGEIDQGIELLRKALGKSPTVDILPVLKFQLARSLRMKGKPGEAVEVLRDFEASFPKNPLLVNVLYTMALAQHDQRQLGPAEALYRSIIKRFAGTPAALEAHFELATVLADSGQRAEAADLFRKYAALNPSSEIAARALERAGDMLLFKSPRQSAELYALAVVKWTANPKPANPDLMLSRWLGAKTKAAGILSRVWLVALGGAGVLGLLALMGMRLLRRRSAARAAGA